VDDLTPLLGAAADGDRDALERLVQAAQADVWRFCASLVGRPHADDATQETFVRAWRSARTFRGDASARTWLLAIARRVCYDHRRRDRRHHEIDERRDSVAVADVGGVVDLDDLVDRLQPDRRTAFVLTQLHGLSYQEAAEVCGCPIGTIRSRVARARADLVDGWAGDQRAPDGRAGG
jgi:RNA polymerase sigma-70 factor (ECF subfamily)